MTNVDFIWEYTAGRAREDKEGFAVTYMQHCSGRILARIAHEAWYFSLEFLCDVSSKDVCDLRFATLESAQEYAERMLVTYDPDKGFPKVRANKALTAKTKSVPR